MLVAGARRVSGQPVSLTVLRNVPQKTLFPAAHSGFTSAEIHKRSKKNSGQETVSQLVLCCHFESAAGGESEGCSAAHQS